MPCLLQQAAVSSQDDPVQGFDISRHAPCGLEAE